MSIIIPDTLVTLVKVASPTTTLDPVNVDIQLVGNIKNRAGVISLENLYFQILGSDSTSSTPLATGGITSNLEVEWQLGGQTIRTDNFDLYCYQQQGDRSTIVGFGTSSSIKGRVVSDIISPNVSSAGTLRAIFTTTYNGDTLWREERVIAITRPTNETQTLLTEPSSFHLFSKTGQWQWGKATIEGTVTRNGKNVTISNITMYFSPHWGIYGITPGGFNTLTPTLTVSEQSVTNSTTYYVDSLYMYEADGSYMTPVPPLTFNDITFQTMDSSILLNWSYLAECNSPVRSHTNTGSTRITLPPYGATSLYGSVNSLSEKTEQFYGPRYKVENFPNQTGTVDYAAFDSRYRTKADISKKPVQLTLTQDDSFAVIYEDGTSTDLDPIRRCSLWGFSDEVVNSPIVSSFATREIAKFYGSVNGQTKLIYKN